MKHTPGPWTYIPRRVSLPDEFSIIKKIDRIVVEFPIAVVRSGSTKHMAESESNAKLIAAAPDLLEACQFAKKHLYLVTNDNPMKIHFFHTIFGKFESAIKKATE